MNFGFVTCVQLGFSCMEAIYDVGGELKLAITLNDDQAVNKSGRVYIDQFCRENGIPLVKSSHINNAECISAIKSHDIDWLFIIGWSQIANKELLNTPNKGCIGIHPTLLPIGRGRAAIPWAIIKGLNKTGVTMFKLEEGVDTGDVIAQREIPLSNQSNATWLYEEVNKAHVDIIKSSFHDIANGTAQLHKQDESRATIWEGRKPEDGLINLDGSVFEADALVRATTKPYPGAFYFDDNNNKIIVWEASIDEINDSEKNISFHDGVLNLIKIENKLSR